VLYSLYSFGILNKFDTTLYRMSWIKEEENLLKVNPNYVREPMEKIKCFFLYVNKNDYIEHIANEYIDIIDGIISNERMLKIIKDKRYSRTNAKFVYKDAQMFVVDLEPEQIQDYSNNENFAGLSRGFLKPLPLFDDIVVIPSVFIFHDTNAIYFSFHEVEPDERLPIKPAIRILSETKPKAKTGAVTKRVRIVLNKTRRVN
jgi:hypothetical protein